MNTLASKIRTSRPASLQRLDRTHRRPRLLALMARAAHAKWLHVHAIWVRRRLDSATQIALRNLDNRNLHDLGLDRSQISSIAAEAARNHAVPGSAFSDDDGEYLSRLRGSEQSGLPRPREA
jgi:uncharacterized protein YjiS (DUF1127 family)